TRAATAAALSAGSVASTVALRPSSVAGPSIMRASWPAPTMPISRAPTALRSGVADVTGRGEVSDTAASVRASAARARSAPHHGPLRERVEVIAGAGAGHAARGHVGARAAGAPAHPSLARGAGAEHRLHVVLPLLAGGGDEEDAEGCGVLGEQLETAAVILDEGAGQGQAHAGPARAAPGDGALEDARAELGIDAGALVRDLHDSGVLVAAHLDGGAAAAVDEGVLDEGRDDLGERTGRAPHGGAARDEHPQLAPGAAVGRGPFLALLGQDAAQLDDTGGAALRGAG